MLGVIADTRDASKTLGNTADRLESPNPALRHLADELARYEQEVFASSGNGQWPALSPDTVRIKGHGRALIDTGGLLDAFTTASVVDDDTVAVPTNAPAYTKYVARRRNPSPQPPRYLAIEWAEVLLGYVVDGRA